MNLESLSRQELIKFIRTKVYNVNHVAKKLFPMRDDRLLVLDCLNMVEYQNFKCAKCKESFNTTTTRPTVDHILPYRRGGKNVIGNVQFLCKECNSIKGIQHVNYLLWTPEEIAKGESEDRRPQMYEKTQILLSKACTGREKAPRFNNSSQVNGISFNSREQKWNVNLTHFKVVYSMGKYKTLEEAKMAKENEFIVALIGPLPKPEDTSSSYKYYSLLSKEIKDNIKRSDMKIFPTVLHPMVGYGLNTKGYGMDYSKLTFRDWTLDRLNLFSFKANAFIFLPGWEGCENASSIMRRSIIFHTPYIEISSTKYSSDILEFLNNLTTIPVFPCSRNYGEYE